jgi:hypothetical protein
VPFEANSLAPNPDIVPKANLSPVRLMALQRNSPADILHGTDCDTRTAPQCGPEFDAANGRSRCHVGLSASITHGPLDSFLPSCQDRGFRNVSIPFGSYKWLLSRVLIRLYTNFDPFIFPRTVDMPLQTLSLFPSNLSLPLSRDNPNLLLATPFKIEQ